MVEPGSGRNLALQFPLRASIEQIKGDSVLLRLPGGPELIGNAGSANKPFPALGAVTDEHCRERPVFDKTDCRCREARGECLCQVPDNAKVHCPECFCNWTKKRDRKQEPAGIAVCPRFRVACRPFLQELGFLAAQGSLAPVIHPVSQFVG